MPVTEIIESRLRGAVQHCHRNFRAGFVTSALDRGTDPLKVMKQTRQVKVDTHKVYDRRESGFEDHAGEKFP